MKKLVWALSLGIVIVGTGLTMEQIQLNHQQHTSQRQLHNSITAKQSTESRFTQAADLPILHVWETTKDLSTTHISTHAQRQV